MKALRKQIHDLISSTIELGKSAPLEWIAAQIAAEHSDVHGEDADFWIGIGKERLDGIVRQILTLYKPSADQTAQLTLEGFEHLQKAYFMARDGAGIIVPVDQCTDIELLERAREYDEMAAGCRAHAREIRGYVSARAGRAA